MDHQDTVNAKLLDRYVLGELNGEERLAFEEHFFSCAECAEELVSAVKFVDNARRPLLRMESGSAPKEEVKPETSLPAPIRPGLAEEVVGQRGQWWDRWLALAPKPALAGACGCLAAALAWQSIPGTPVPEVMGSYFVTATRSGGGGPRRITKQPGQQRIALLFNHTDATVPQFDFVLESAAGRAIQHFQAEAPRETNDIEVMIPVTGLGAGVYLLRVKNAVTGTEIAALPFELAER